MIKNTTPRTISAYVSGVLSFILLFILLIIKIEPAKAIFTSFLFGFICFFIFFLALELFIYRKIKIIFKTIHNLKKSNFDKKYIPFQFKQNEDPLEKVEEEVLEWGLQQRQQITELEKQEQFRREFLGNVSHELKTPIFSIQGYIHTLLDGAISDPSVNIKFLQKAADNTDRLQHLVEDLLLISKLETGDIPLNIERFDIIELTKLEFENLELKAEKKKIKLEIKGNIISPFFVYADKIKIKQVLENLITNSIKYGKNGGEIVFSCYELDDTILCEISDDGNGIEEEHLPRLFERFYRVDKSRSRDIGGTGLGLAIVKHIIERHNQTINVRSSIGKGTTFGFTLSKEKFN